MNFIKDIKSVFKKIELPIVYSTDLKSVFALMLESEDPTINKIVRYINRCNGEYCDITLFDVVDSNTISFIQSSRVDRLNKTKYDTIDLFRREAYNMDFYGWETQRSTMSIGRFLTKILNIADEKILDAEKEIFINSFKSNYVVLKRGVKDIFFIVDGEKIRDYYNEKSYMTQDGQLGNSCMKKESCSDFLTIYVNNPEVCKLLCLIGTNNKIKGRAILWTLDTGEQFLDRIYTNNDSDINLFGTYIRQMGIKYSHRFNYANACIKLKPVEYSYYPYMDTFRYYQPSTGLLCNNHIDKKLYDTGKLLELKGTNGRYTDTFELTEELAF